MRFSYGVCHSDKGVLVSRYGSTYIYHVKLLIQPNYLEGNQYKG